MLLPALPPASASLGYVAAPLSLHAGHTLQRFICCVGQEEYDLDQKIDTGKLIDSAGAGRSFFSPGWLTQLNQLWGGKSVRGVRACGWAPAGCMVVWRAGEVLAVGCS